MFSKVVPVSESVSVSHNKHSCVLSNTGLSNAPTTTGICTSLKSDFYFRFHSPLNTKSALLSFFSVCAIWCSSVEKCAHQSLKTAKIGIRTSLKSANYFRFVSQTIGDNATTFLSPVQNFVKIGKELWTQSFDNRSVNKHTDRRKKLIRASIQCIG